MKNFSVIKWAMLFVLSLGMLMGHKAHASCTGITGGMTEAQVVTAINSCNTAGGGVINATAGTYGPFASVLTLPCAVSIAGPTVTLGQTHDQTAIFIGTTSFTGVPIHTTAGCSVTQNISYLEWNGEQSSGSGGFIYVTAGTNHLTINNDWMHGANGGAYPGNTSEAQIYFAGTGTNLANPTQNVQILNDEFGPEGSAADCGAAMTEQDTEAGGGYCAGILFNGYEKTILVDGNNFHYLEQGIKVIEATTNGGSTQNSGNTNGLTVTHNSFTQIQRIPFETQSNYYTTLFPTFQTIEYNYFGNRYNGAGGQQNFDMSVANGCGNPPATAICTALFNFNIDVQNVNNAVHGAGNEFWGDKNTTANYNWFEGYVAGAGGAIDWSQTGSFNFNNNIFNIFGGSGTNCVSQGGGYWNNESGNHPAGTPTCTGNTYSSAGSGTRASALPTISPASGTFTGTQTVSFANSGVNLDANTNIWYTTDGTTPVPGTGTATFAAAGSSITISATTTVNAIGMWGAQNQPTSYPSGYGYVPSAMVSATYTSGGAGTIASGNLSTSPVNGVNTAAVGGATIQFIPVVNYSGGTQQVSIAPTACSWSTLSGGTLVFSVNSSGVMTATGSGSDNVIATCSGVALSQWTVTVAQAPGPTLTGIAISPAVSINTGSTTFSTVGQYSDGSQSAISGATWTSGNTAVSNVNSQGTATPSGIGTSIISTTFGGFSSQAAVVVPPNVLYPNPVANNFPFSNSNFGCYVFQRLTAGTYTLTVNADGSFTIH